MLVGKPEGHRPAWEA